MNKVGIDVSEDWLDVAVRLQGQIKHNRFRNTGAGRNQLHRWLKKIGFNRCGIYLEATGRYFEALAVWAHKLGWEVFVINPRLIRKFAEAKLGYNKNDKLDAKAILRFAESSEPGELAAWTPKTHAQLELRDIQMEIAGLQKMISAEQSRLKCGLCSTTVAQFIRSHIKSLKQQQNNLLKTALQVIKQDAKLARRFQILLSQKGIGTKTAVFLLAKVDFDKFAKGRQTVAFAGIAPAEFSSGKSVHRKEHISRVGHADLRDALYFPAVAAMTHDPELVEFKNRLLARGKLKKVIICAVMARILRTSYSLIRDDRLFQDRTRLAAA